MRIDKMTASFGKLKQQSLTLSPGLNIIEAPNESGKSTWCAFIRTILYGLSTRERGALADKNRFAPWDGSPMQGSLELTDNGRSITLRRDTARANSPMGRFSAVFTGTAEAVPELNSENCGETLLGVPREVFERSAFIRQTGLAVDQSPELERRIAALLSTGEEQSSFSEVYDALKKELNRHRHNKTGLLPTLESEISALEAALTRCDQLQSRLDRTGAEIRSLTDRADRLQAELRQHELAEQAQQWAETEQARLAAEAAEAHSDECQVAICRDGLPSEDALRQHAAQIDTIRQGDDRRAELLRQTNQAESVAAAAENRASAHPFHPRTPEQIAAEPLAIPPRPRLHPASYAVIPVLGAFAAGALIYFTKNLWLTLGTFLLLVSVMFLGATLLNKKKVKLWENEIVRLRQERDEAISVYTTLYNEATAAKRAADEAHAAEAAHAAGHRAALQKLLDFVSAFQPVTSLTEAESALCAALSRRKESSEAETLAREAKLRYDILRRHFSELDAPQAPVPKPDSDPAALQRELDHVKAELADDLRQRSLLEGERNAIGDRSELQESLDSRNHRHAELQHEYDAIKLAMETLSDANAELQSRFSPALGQETARIFASLTGGKYASVFLDRTLSASAAEVGDNTPRSAATLSQGCADQLYLALRLAIARMVLPANKPLILDDALTSFDDVRLAHALDFLLEESRNRQILLFTCQSREGSYLAGKEGVTTL